MVQIFRLIFEFFIFKTGRETNHHNPTLSSNSITIKQNIYENSWSWSFPWNGSYLKKYLAKSQSSNFLTFSSSQNSSYTGTRFLLIVWFCFLQYFPVFCWIFNFPNSFLVHVQEILGQTLDPISFPYHVTINSWLCVSHFEVRYQKPPHKEQDTQVGFSGKKIIL